MKREWSVEAATQALGELRPLIALLREQRTALEALKQELLRLRRLERTGARPGGSDQSDLQAIDADGAPAIANNFGSGSVAGFVHRDQQGLITTFLADASMVVPKGLPVTVHSGGGFAAKNDGKEAHKLLAGEIGDLLYHLLVLMVERGVSLQDIADKINAASAQAWQQYLDALAKKGEIKSDELEWTGLREWLQMQPGKVKREQVAEFLKNNGVQVQEVSRQTIGDVVNRLNRALSGSGWAAEHEDEEISFTDGEDLYSLEELPDDVRSLVAPIAASSSYETKYHKWAVPGGKHYREVLLTLPNQSKGVDFASPEFRAAAAAQYGERFVDRLSVEQRELVAEKMMGTLGTKFQSSHWDEPNVLAHIRVDERTDAAYSALAARRNQLAIAHLERAIDAGLEPPEGDDPPPTPQAMLDMREAHADATRNWGFDATLSYRGGGMPSGPLLTTTPGEANAWQAGVEAYWRPFGPLGDRMFEVYARAFESFGVKGGESSGAQTLQASVGARVKPFSDLNVI